MRDAKEIRAEGFVAFSFCRGVSAFTPPYQPKTPELIEWLGGFSDAKREFQNYRRHFPAESQMDMLNRICGIHK